MTRFLLPLILLLVAVPAAAQTTAPTLANSKAEVARVSGKPTSTLTTWAKWWQALKAAPTYVAPPPPAPRDPWDEVCTLNTGDAYALSDATRAIVQATVTNQYGEPCTRSYALTGVPSNGPGMGYGYWDYPANPFSSVFPSNGSRIEWIVPIKEPQRGRVGRFPFTIHNTEGLGVRQVWINIVDAYPAGVTPAVSFGPLPAPSLKLPARAPDLSGDFIKDRALWESDSFSLNDGEGWFVTPGVTRTRSGFAPDPYRIEQVDGRPTLVLRPVDLRDDPIDTRDGTKHWGAPYIRREMPATSGVFQVTVDFGPSTSPTTPDDAYETDNAWWGYKASRPTEQDNHEHFSAGRDSNGYNRFPIVTYHENSGSVLEGVRWRKISFNPFGNKLGKHVLTRVRSVEQDVTDYYVDGVRVIEARNIGLLQHWMEAFSIELAGKVAGGYNPTRDYSRSTITLYDWKWWTLRPGEQAR